MARHGRRLSGPLVDRLDIVVRVERPTSGALAGPPSTSSSAEACRVARARELQMKRSGCPNAQLTVARLGEARCSDEALALLHRAYDSGALSARGRDRALRVARTIADLRESDVVEAGDVADALAYRHEAGEVAVR